MCFNNFTLYKENIIFNKLIAQKLLFSKRINRKTFLVKTSVSYIEDTHINMV